MGLTFKKASKRQSKLRMSIAGPSGSGKTYSSLKIAMEMGGKIAVIDTERGSAAKYSDIFDFDVIELEDFHPERYIEAIQAAEKGGYDVLIIDSTTHEWNGKNGILELHEAAVQRQRTKNSYAAWAEVTPLHNAFINAILQCKCHVIASVRSKTDYVQEKNDRGYTEVKKVGMASIQREGMDYEYDIMMEMNIDHVGVITKTRCAALDGKAFKKPGREIAEILNAWLSDGAPAEPATKPASLRAVPTAQATVEAETVEAEAMIDDATMGAIRKLWPDYGFKKDGQVQPLTAWLKANKHVNALKELPAETGAKMLEWLQKRALAAQQAEAQQVEQEPKAEGASGLDQWACGRALAMQVLQATERAEAAGITEDQWRAELADFCGHDASVKVSRKDLLADKAEGWAGLLNEWAAANEAKTAA